MKSTKVKKPKEVKKIPASKLRKKLIKDCDTLVSLIVRLRDKRCMTCPPGQQRSPKLECGHLFSRRFYSTKFSLINCNAQCQFCNSLHRFDEFPYTNWFIGHYGKEAWEKLYAERKQTKSWKVFELEELKEELKAKLQAMVDGS